MTGEARNIGEPFAFAAALEGAVERLLSLLKGLEGAARRRLRPTPRTAPQAVFAGTPVIPTVRYRDVPKAVDWLCRAFGMQVHRVVADAGGAPCYAELTVGSGMLMVAPIEDTPFGKLMVQPDEIGGVETQVCYLCVTNAWTHYKRAKAAGAVILLDPDDEANRGRGYSCRDPEGHVWNFGTYDPWAGQVPASAAARPRISRRWRSWRSWRTWGTWRSWRPGRLLQGLSALLLLAVASTLLPELVPQPSASAGTAAIAAPPSPAPSATGESRPVLAAATATETIAPEAHNDRFAIEAAERVAADARAELAAIRGALEKAERDAAAARTQLDAVQRAREAADRAAAEARASLAATQQSEESARAEAVQERARRLAADRAAATTARRRSTVNLVRSRARWSRSWCYNPLIPSPASAGAGRLTGFCKT
jgi:uncharacterized glyoxalase superfamily protein PhnB/Skp family chaperone for outer membrane proteins